MPKSDAKAVLQAYIDATTKDDPDKCASFFAETCALETPCVPPPVPRSITGRDNIRNAFAYLFAEVFAKFEILDFEIYATEDPEVAFAKYKSRVKLRSGRDYGNEYVLVARVRDGLFIEYVEFMDTTRAAMAFEGTSGKGLT